MQRNGLFYDYNENEDEPFKFGAVAKGLSKGLGKGAIKGLGKGATKGLSKGLGKGLGKGLSKGVGKGVGKGAAKGASKGLGKGLAKSVKSLGKGLSKNAGKIAVGLAVVGGIAYVAITAAKAKEISNTNFAIKKISQGPETGTYIVEFSDNNNDSPFPPATTAQLAGTNSEPKIDGTWPAVWSAGSVTVTVPDGQPIVTPGTAGTMKVIGLKATDKIAGDIGGAIGSVAGAAGSAAGAVLKPVVSGVGSGIFSFLSSMLGISPANLKNIGFGLLAFAVLIAAYKIYTMVS